MTEKAAAVIDKELTKQVAELCKVKAAKEKELAPAKPKKKKARNQEAEAAEDDNSAAEDGLADA